MLVTARRLIRKMRGGAQAHLLECDGGKFYVVKFRNNPQHRRILVNEWISAAFLRYLQIPAPETAIVDLSRELLEATPDIHLQLGSRRQQPDPGWHFGSRHPGDPSRMAVYDFIPDQLLENVVNLSDFRAVLVFDQWMGNADARQAIFFRARLKEWTAVRGEHPNKMGFVAQMVDQGYVFNGPHWDFSDSPLQGLYFRPIVYRGVKSLADFQPWLDQVIHFPEEVVDDALKRIPPEWLGGDEEELDRLLNRLMGRRRRVPELIEQCAAARSRPFPDWAAR